MDERPEAQIADPEGLRAAADAEADVIPPASASPAWAGSNQQHPFEADDGSDVDARAVSPVTPFERGAPPSKGTPPSERLQNKIVAGSHCVTKGAISSAQLVGKTAVKSAQVGKSLGDGSAQVAVASAHVVGKTVAVAGRTSDLVAKTAVAGAQVAGQSATIKLQSAGKTAAASAHLAGTTAGDLTDTVAVAGAAVGVAWSTAQSWAKEACNVKLHAPARVAALLEVDADLEHLRSEEDIKVILEADVMFFGQERKLVVARPMHHAEHPNHPASQLAEFMGRMDEMLRKHRAPQQCCVETWLWPLHVPHETKVKLQHAGSLGSDPENSVLWSVLDFLHIYVEEGGEDFIQFMRDLYGAATAYHFAAGYFMIQHLWLLTVVGLVVIAASAGGGSCDPGRKVLWEVSKALIVLWGIVVAYRAQRRERFLLWSSATLAKRKVRNPAYREKPGVFQIFAVQFTLAWSARVAFFCLVFSAVSMHIQFKFWLMYGARDCGLETECDFEFGNFIAGLLADIAFAGILEGLKELAKVLGHKIASMENHEYEDDNLFSAAITTLLLESVATSGVFMLLGVMFVPQWSAPTSDLVPSCVGGVAGRPGYGTADCTSTFLYDLFGEGSIICLSYRINHRQRVALYEGAMAGALIVPPFINILMQYFVPLLVENLDQCCRRRGYSNCLLRLLAVLFVYDGGSVGCLKYVKQGWPFRELKLLHEGFEVEEEGVKDGAELAALAFEDGALRPVVPIEEILELQMTFLIMVLFAPCLPLLIFIFFIVRQVESHTDLSKLLFSRRRIVPTTALLVHESFRVYLRTVAVLAVPWSVALSLFTYNEQLYELTGMKGQQ